MKKEYQIWIPRVLTVLISCFLSIFAFDVFDSKESFIRIILGLLIHLIPTFLMLIAFLFSFKNKSIAGFGMVFLGIVFTLFFNTYESWINFALISLPVLLAGALYLLVKENKSVKSP
jgi:hypothetical protein